MWYMDDSTLGGDVTNLLHDLNIVESVDSKLGLVLNERKSELVTADADVLAVVRQKIPDVIHFAPEDATLLGAPMGGQRAAITYTLIIPLVIFKHHLSLKVIGETYQKLLFDANGPLCNDTPRIIRFYARHMTSKVGTYV
jgi:hypothetical protein